MAQKKSLLNRIANFVESLGESPKTTRQHQSRIPVVQRLGEGVVIDKYSYVAASILLMALILGACQGAAPPHCFPGRACAALAGNTSTPRWTGLRWGGRQSLLAGRNGGQPLRG